VALLHRVADQRVLGLQVQDVELVDAGRHQQQRALEDLGRQRLVFDELEQVVLEHDGAFGGAHVAAHFEQRFIGHGDMALAQVLHEVLQALGNAFALGLQGQRLRFGVEGQEVAGRRRGHPLLDGETHAGAGFLVGLHGLGQAHQRPRVQQVGGGGERGHRVVGPGFAGETAVGLQRLLGAGVPQGGRLAHVLLLQFLELLGGELQCRRRGRTRGHGRHVGERGSAAAHRAAQHLTHDLLELLGGLLPA
jgi:hypothetical protein